VSAFSF